MDYADGICMDMFTAGQSVRMKSQMQTYRSNIYSASNLSAAGINSDGSYRTLTPASIKAPYLIDFNGNTPFWFIENFMNPINGWQVNYQVGANDGTSMYINSYANGAASTLNTRDAFHTTNVDITSLVKPTLTFKIAHARRVTAASDQINVFVSDNFGRTETLAKVFTVTDLETAEVTGTAAFVPTANQWKTLTLDLTPFKTFTNCRVRFELQSRRGNNTYIDDIKFGEFTTSIANLPNSSIQLNISPNPTNENSIINFTNITTSNVTINLFDISGKFVKHIMQSELGAGEQKVELNGAGLAKGIYFIKLEQNDQSFTSKWIVN